MSNINFFRVLQNFIATGDAPDPTDWTEVRSADLNPPLVIPSAGHFRPDGSVYFGMCTAGNPTNDSIYSFNMSTNWDITTIGSYNSTVNYEGWNTIYPSGLWFKPDGSKLFVLVLKSSSATSTPLFVIYEHDLSTNWDITTINTTNVATKSINGSDFGGGTVINLNFNANGTKCFVGSDYSPAGTSIDRDLLVSYNLSTAYDITSMSTTHNYILTASNPTDNFNVRSYDFQDSGYTLYGGGNIQTNFPNTPAVYKDSIVKWTLTTAYDLSTATYNTIYELPTNEGSDVDLLWKSNTEVFQLRQSEVVKALMQYSFT